MKKTFGGPTIFLDRADINTDEIIPAKYLTEVTKEALKPYCLEDLKLEGFDPKGEKLARSRVIVTRENFGCGSSREHAVWALEDAGFRVVIAPGFADIFYNNCFKNGVLPIVLDAATMDRLFDAAARTEGYRLQVDLEAQTITTPDGDCIRFEVDEFRRHCLLNGLDDIGLTLQHADAIRGYEARRKQEAPWLF